MKMAKRRQGWHVLILKSLFLMRPFPAEWEEIIRRNVGYYNNLSPSQRKALCRRVYRFLAEKRFEGREGVEVTDEMRVTIAAQACILLLGNRRRCYRTVNTVLIYPSIFGGKRKFWERKSETASSPALGMASNTGLVALSWDHTLEGGRDSADAENVVLHEFAHHLDLEDGHFDGVPKMRPLRRMGFNRVLKKHLALHRTLTEERSGAFLSEYGATNPQEFFAVATEAFFEQPAGLLAAHPELYLKLRVYYNQDPLGSSSPLRRNGLGMWRLPR